MNSQFEATFDSQGHFDLPLDVRQRHGFTNGVKVLIQEQGNNLVIEPFAPQSRTEIQSLTVKEAIEKAVGFMGGDPKGLELLLKERKRF